jgi:hypothetical protein
MIGRVLLGRDLMDWYDTRLVLEVMPVHHMLWEDFEILWREAVMLLSEAGGGGTKSSSSIDLRVSTFSTSLIEIASEPSLTRFCLIKLAR